MCQRCCLFFLQAFEPLACKSTNVFGAGASERKLNKHHERRTCTHSAWLRTDVMRPSCRTNVHCHVRLTISKVGHTRLSPSSTSPSSWTRPAATGGAGTRAARTSAHCCTLHLTSRAASTLTLPCGRRPAARLAKCSLQANSPDYNHTAAMGQIQ